MISIEHVSKKYLNGTTALENISFSVAQGEFVYLVGQSGSGKTTLFKLLYGEELPTVGQVVIGNINIQNKQKHARAYLRRQMGIVFQNDMLLPHLSIYENLAYVLYVLEVPGRKHSEKIAQVLELVGLTEKSKMLPRQLSKGEQQRIAIARALINSPKILIADEPTGNLDDKSAIAIMRLFYRINQMGTTVLMATHNSTLVNTVRYRVLEIQKGRLVRDQLEGNYGLVGDEKDIFIV